MGGGGGGGLSVLPTNDRLCMFSTDNYNVVETFIHLLVCDYQTLTLLVFSYFVLFYIILLFYLLKYKYFVKIIINI